MTKQDFAQMLASDEQELARRSDDLLRLAEVDDDDVDATFYFGIGGENSDVA